MTCYNILMSGSINPLQGILSKYLEKLDEIDIKRNTICKIVKDETGVILKIKEIEIADNIILIRSHPAKRQIIMFNKNNILYNIQNDEKLKNILDIK